MKAGIYMPNGVQGEFAGWDTSRAWERSLQIGVLAERLGFDAVWLPDHLQNIRRHDDAPTFRELEESYGAVRLNPDEWELALGIDPFDEGFQRKLEAEFSGLTQRLLALGTSVILEWGFWARSERDEKRELGRSLGAAVELRFLDVPYDELVRRVLDRHAKGGLAITESHMERYRNAFQPPTDDELALYDPPL